MNFKPDDASETFIPVGMAIFFLKKTYKDYYKIRYNVQLRYNPSQRTRIVRDLLYYIIGYKTVIRYFKKVSNYRYVLFLKVSEYEIHYKIFEKYTKKKFLNI